MFEGQQQENANEETKTKKGKGKGKGNGKDAGAERTKGRGRQGSEKQTVAKQPKVISERIDELVVLHVNAKHAATQAQDAITKAAEDSGYLASSVKKLVVARAGDKFEEKHREVEQQAELFEEVGE